MNTYYCAILLYLLLHCSGKTRAQAPAGAPAPAGPLNVTAVLDKAGQFTTLIRLLRSTHMSDQIDSQLVNSNSGLTLFAPTDNAFSTLSPGTLNSITDQQKVELAQYHVLPSFVSLPQFQTVTNPLRTQAGDATGNGFQLNVTSAGNQVNITTGVVNTTISNAIFSNGQLAVYQVEKVLLPLQIFGSAAAPAPAPAAASGDKKGSLASPADGPSKGAVDASAAAGSRRMATGGLAAAALLSFFWWKL